MWRGRLFFLCLALALLSGCAPGGPVAEAGADAQMCIRDREYVGHGVGAQMHESPEIPNYGHPGRGPRLLRGMTLAIEPMVNAGSAAIQQMSDGWTVKTLDGKWAAHYENSILITDGEPEILTAPAI